MNDMLVWILLLKRVWEEEEKEQEDKKVNV